MFPLTRSKTNLPILKALYKILNVFFYIKFSFWRVLFEVIGWYFETIFTYFRKKNSLRFPWCFETFCSRTRCQIRRLFRNWTHEIIPDREHSARFRKSQLLQVRSASRKHSDASWGSAGGEERSAQVPAWLPALLVLAYILFGKYVQNSLVFSFLFSEEWVSSFTFSKVSTSCFVFSEERTPSFTLSEERTTSFVFSE